MRGRWISSIAGGLLLAACAGQPENPSPSLNVGSAGATYGLAAVDGQRLPATAYFGVDVSVHATAGTLVLRADHGYTLRVSYVRHFASGDRDVDFTQTEQGTWSATGTELTLAPTAGTAHRAALAGNQVTMALTVEASSPPERATKSYTFMKTQ